MKIGIRTRIVALLIAVCLIVTAGSVLLSYLVATEFERSVIRRAEVTTAQFVSNQAKARLRPSDFEVRDLQQKDPLFSEFMAIISTKEIIRIKVWAADGTIVFSDAKEIVGERFADNAYFAQAMTGATTIVIKPPVSEDNRFEKGYEQLMEIYVPISFADGSVAGVIETYTRLDFVNDEVRTFRAIIAWFNAAALLGVILMGLAAFVWLEKFMARPVRRLHKAATAVAAGDLGTQVAVKRRDEIGQLAEAFNHMVADLKTSRNELVAAKIYVDKVLASMNDALAVLSSDCTVRSVNKALAELLGFSEAELVGMPMGSILAGEPDVPGFLRRSSGRPNVEATLRTKAGLEVTVLLSAAGFAAGPDEEPGMVCVAQDITERKQMERRLIHSNRQMHDDLQHAAEFQRAALPRILQLPYLDIAVKFLPYSEVSGDIYDMRSNRERELTLFVGDATGHGVAAAFMTMMVQIGLDGMEYSWPTNKVLTRLNDMLYMRNTGKFMTGVILRIAPDGRLRVSNAGHPPVIVLPRDGGRCVVLSKGGTALGMFAESPVPYAEEMALLSPGDKVIVYTDGVTEWADGEGEQFGEERLIQSLEKRRRESIGAVLDRLLEDIKNFSGSPESSDDLTAIGFEYRAPV